MKLRKIIKYLILIIAILVVFTIGLSYAAFTAKITGSEKGTTIYSSSGVMQIDYDGGPAINAPEMFPSNDEFATKTFTVTGKSSVEEDMEYHLILVMNSNTFRTGALTYTLDSKNTGNNGEVVPNIKQQKGIKTGEGEYILGNAKFSPTSSEEKVHTYTLKLYFPLIDGFDHSVDQNKEFSAKIEIREGHFAHPLLRDVILAEFGGVANIQEAPEGTFNFLSGENDNLMYKIEDDYGDSYYFRGAKEHVKNNLIFAEHQWKIVRINGDESIRIIYNGKCPNNACEINDVGVATQIEKTPFNVEYTDNKYVGYMYGGEPGVPSTSYEQAHSNDTSSTIKEKLEMWYSLNILERQYESYIYDSLFCNDRQLEEDVGGLETGPGYGNFNTNYAARYRLTDNKNPDLKCARKIDRFTFDDTIIGNGDLTYPIGLISPDEASLAGLVFPEITYSNYLYTGEYYWTIGARSFSSGFAFGWGVHSTGDLNGNGVRQDFYGMRSVVNLKPNTKVTGTGTLNDPYVVF